ncbi:bis(5'-nucleosyl)-tetraphosphatase (symmetrical) YqeK [Cetobacterium sp. SF1]|uniref:bis(5'-nucleosyl)-tetraphosphatase (symmetrical) YqeK n=1 Tax=Cetobacterium sp. SF1 TaxID=3417654 RepID=UPI003CEAD073
MLLKEIRENLKNKVSEKRYNHILGVEETAVKLAKRYGVKEEDARIAALLHDYAKQFSVYEMEKICIENFYEETKDYIDQGEILHGYVGAYIAEKEFNIIDKNILDAIKYHTTGKRGLSILGKIIYIADSIEPGRDYPTVKIIREAVEEDINKGIIIESSEKIKYLVDIGAKVHLYTVDMRNWLLEKK